MENAILFYQETDCYNNIVELLGKQEEIFLDFKETRTIEGRMLEDDRSTFSKAASGFAHQEGGVLVWGIEAREDPATEIDCAIDLKPINNVKRFLSDLNKYIKDSTEPAVDGIQHKVIFENDDENSNRGFVVSLFPKSNQVHKALGPGKTRHRFYRRHGDSFVPLDSTADIRALFFRSLSPDLQLNVFPKILKGLSVSPFGSGVPFGLGFALENRGTGIAKNCSVSVLLQGEEQFSWDAQEWFNPEGTYVYIIAQLLDNYDRVKGKTRSSSRYIKLNPGIVICPEEEIEIAMVSCRYKGAEGTVPTVIVEYKIFAENMIPKEGSIEVAADLGAT